ncbi:hypothetical protein RBH20_20965 [Haloarcula sp. H-GB4]|uniref:hypothetical protein n=1 Tax=Haloarcula sp. H-GB4 TaxID=3069755 RepID=UPI0027AF15CD|nr:hypothetical protein [Haloarcula sp. H-GB4]MDQ2074994.1 hypothetical protein [Haloarcula sp. H-GB4]
MTPRQAVPSCAVAVSQHPARPSECRMGESPAAQRSEQPGTQGTECPSSFRRGSAGREGSSSRPRATLTRASTTVVLCRSSRVGLKGARRWRLLESVQRPLSERSEDMSLSDRQRRGAFEVCWSDTELVVATLFAVVPVQQVPAFLR